MENYSPFHHCPRLSSCVFWICSLSWRKPCTGREMALDPPHTVTRSCSWSWPTWSQSTAFSYVGPMRETCQPLWAGKCLGFWAGHLSRSSLSGTLHALSFVGWGSKLSGTWRGWSESSLVTWRFMMDQRRKLDWRYWKPWNFSCSIPGPGIAAKQTGVLRGVKLSKCSL